MDVILLPFKIKRFNVLMSPIADGTAAKGKWDLVLGVDTTTFDIKGLCIGESVVVATQSTNQFKLDESQYERFADIWNEHVLTEAKVWTDFHEYWMQQKIPLLTVRYEDLLLHRERELGRIFRFLPALKDNAKPELCWIFSELIRFFSHSPYEP